MSLHIQNYAHTNRYLIIKKYVERHNKEKIILHLFLFNFKAPLFEILF